MEVPGGPASTTLLTAVAGGVVPTTAAGTVPPPACAQLPTHGVELDRYKLFDGNEFYGDHLGGAGQGDVADARGRKNLAMNCRAGKTRSNS